MSDQTTRTREDYAGLVGAPFSVKLADTEVPIELIEVKELGSGQREGGAFSLLWQGPVAPVLAQATYQVSHEELGTHDFFLVPVAQIEAGLQYEAIFT